MRTSELVGHDLNVAVHKALNVGHPWRYYGQAIPNYCNEWKDGGPIIEREINVLEKRDGYWYSWRAKRNDGYITTSFDTIPSSREAWAHGKTPLVAAMRCYCCAKLGEEVDIPEELYYT